MTSYLGSLTTHYNSIKRLLPSHLSPDADNTISDPSDSHVSRVLRAYYTEKGRPFPPWLGSDPNAPVRPQPNYVSQSRQSGPVVAAASGLSATKRGGLGDLFGDSPESQIQQQQEEPLSLRSRRGAFKAQTQIAPPQATYAAQPVARPLPSQRHGSYQSRSSDSGSPFPQSTVKEQTAQERLRARLGSAKGVSPVGTPSPGANFDSRSKSGENSSFNPYESSSGGYNPYESGGGGGGGGGGGFNLYDNGSKTSYDSSARNQRPYTSSNSPWSTGGDPGDMGSGTGKRVIGLPQNPRSRR